MSPEPAVANCAVEAITDAISAHLLTARICEHGLGALSTLASSQVKDVYDVVDLIISCMWTHSERATVCQGALAALTKLILDQRANRVMEMSSDDLDAIENAMRTHLLVKDVQENAIILLRNLTFCSVNLNLIGQNPSLVGLVKSAQSNFHSSLRVNVQDLLRMLPTDGQ